MAVLTDVRYRGGFYYATIDGVERMIDGSEPRSRFVNAAGDPDPDPDDVQDDPDDGLAEHECPSCKFKWKSKAATEKVPLEGPAAAGEITCPHCGKNFEQKASAKVIENRATARFAAERRLRANYGVVHQVAGAGDYQAALKRYIAAEIKWNQEHGA